MSLIELPPSPPQETEVLFEPFPKQQEFIDAALSGNYTFVLFGGAIRGGKTFAMLAIFLILCRIFPGSRWAIVRKDLPVIKKNLYPSWDKIKPTNFIRNHNQETHTVTFKNGSQIIFFPESYSTDKNQDRWKGLEVNGFGFEEINECQKASLEKAFERAGTYIIKGLAKQPKPLVIATCNPTQGWVKELVYTPHEKGTLKASWKYIQSRIYDNLPLLKAQPDLLPSLIENLSKYAFMVFVEGKWNVQLKTGNEFLRGFELGKHVKPLYFEGQHTAHISLDSNVLPHIAITCWQLIRDGVGGWLINQVDELPAKDPENTASRAGQKIVRWLQMIEYKQPVYLYGDRSTKNRNNIDDDKRSFFQIVEQTIREAGFKTVDRILGFAPPVASIAAFVNAIFDGEIPGLEIQINEICTESINDYIETKTDKDGTILKKRITLVAGGPSFEPNGHLTDTLKDFIVQAFFEEYKQYVNKYNELIPGGVAAISRTPKVTL